MLVRYLKTDELVCIPSLILSDTHMQYFCLFVVVLVGWEVEEARFGLFFLPIPPQISLGI